MTDTPHTHLIGITGGIGSGKSYVSAALGEHGFPIYDCDREAKRIIEQDTTVRQALTQRFGAETYTLSENTITYNRTYVASLVFQHPELLQQLNAIVHPAVYQDIQHWSKRQTAPYAFVESAILFESGWADLFDAIICVTAPLEERIRRTIARNHTTREQVESRIRNQMSDEERQAHSHLIITNDGTLSCQQITTQILTFLNKHYASTSSI